MKSNFEKSLVIHTASVDEVVSSMSAINWINSKSKQLQVVVRDPLLPLFVDEAPEFVAESKFSGGKFDLVVDFDSSTQSRALVNKTKANYCLGRSLKWWHRLKRTHLYNKQIMRDQGHVVADYWAIVKELSGLDFNKKPALVKQVDDKVRELYQKIDSEKVAAVNFYAESEHRRIPPKTGKVILDTLKQHGYRVWIVDRTTHFTPWIENEDNTVFHPLSLADLKSVFCLVDAFIGCDNGPSFIAGAVDCPSLIWFGPRRASQFKPLNAKVQAFEQEFDCRPCNERLECPHNQRCLDVDQRTVKNTVVNFLNSLN